MSHSHGKTEPCACPECNVQQMARNHYFTGKLMVERDFTDEQRYFRGKLHRHNRHLHGSGVVCGLKVVQHPNEKCQDKFVIVEPGTAIDCCGHEILVPDELRGHGGRKGVLFPFAKNPKIEALRQANDDHPHTLQICLRYKECPTEDIPVLYDECGCDDTQCAPNRVLESYELDLMLDEEIKVDEPHSVKLEWKHTIPLAHSTHVALHDGARRLFVISATATGSAIHAINTVNDAIVDSVTLTEKALALALSPDGKHLYVAVDATPAEVRVLNAANLAANPLATLSTSGTPGNLSVLSATSDGRLFGLFGSSGQVAVWNTPATSSSPSTVIPLSPNLLADLVFSTDEKSAFSADATLHNAAVIDTTAAPPVKAANPVSVDPSAAPSILALAHSTAGDSLAVGDQLNKRLYLVPLGIPGAAVSTATLSDAPVALVASPGANWIYVLEKSAAQPGKWFVEPVNVQRMLLGKPPLGPRLEVGANACALALSESGRTLYVAFDDAHGGVALVEVTDTDCGEHLWRSLEGCPSCEIADCIILATIERYHVGDRLLDQVDPPPDTTQSGIAWIDNRKGRRLLPSTQALAEVVECLLEHSPTAAGTQGPPGPAGAGVKSTDAATVAPTSPATATFNPATGHIHFEIPQGQPGLSGSGAAGPPGEGLEKGLTRIAALSWRHNSKGNELVSVDRLDVHSPKLAIVIGFTREVFVNDPNHPNVDGQHVFQVLVQHGTPPLGLQPGFRCRCAIVGEVIPVNFTEDFPGHIHDAKEVKEHQALGVAFVFPTLLENLVKEMDDLWVILRGDFVLDSEGRAIDAEFVRAELQTGDRPKGSDFGIQGGTFESWFSIRD